MHFLTGLATVFGLGIVYFVSTVPAGVAFGLPIWLAALVGWLGYSAGGLVAILIPQTLRDRLMQKLKIHPNPEKPSPVMRAWNRYGLPALGFLAPVTIGSPTGALLALALGANRWTLILAISLGALPWAITFAVLFACGVKLVK
jgi:hypothetical protein